MRQIFETPEGRARVEDGVLRLVGAVYELTTDALGGTNIRTIELAELSGSEACELAGSLLGHQRGGDGLSSGAETIAFRSRGSPLFIIQTILGGSHVNLDHSDLDRVVMSRLEELDAVSLGLLETVAVYGGPIPIDLALELRPDATEATVRTLCEQGLLERDATGIETAHDRLREAALSKLTPNERARRHWQIGQRLRAELGEGAEDRIYVAVNHLDAGVVDADALSLELRLELAELNQQAGERALQSTAWVAAHGYFDHAYRLIDPWLADARQGQGQYPLCIATVFGLCQVDVILERESAGDLVDDLLRWSLSPPDYHRIAQWYCEAQFLQARFAEVTVFGIRALRRIGFRVPVRPSWPRALFSYYRGWRAIWNVGLEQIMSKPTATDPRIRAGLEIAAITSACAGFTGPRLLLTIMGSYSRMLTQHGSHDWAAVALAGLAMSAVAVGKNAEAREIIVHAEKFVDAHNTSVSAHCMAHTLLMTVTPSLFPIGHVIARGEVANARAHEVGQRVLIEPIGIMCLVSYFLQGTPLAKVTTFSANLRNEAKGSMFVFASEQLAEMERCQRSLLEGRGEIDLEADIGTNLHAGQRGFMLVLRIMTVVLIGEREIAWALIGRLARDFPNELTLIWPAAVFATTSAVVMAERSSALGPRDRRQILRRIRKHRSTAARWAWRCPENYQPMLDLIDAELSGLADDYSEAVTAYERARSGASANQMTWLHGLASERLAKLASAHGHALLAEAAFDAARDAYEAWGATAVVRRIDQDRKVDASVKRHRLGSAPLA
jgi:tetratricopeptide (TPR) repeat protein